MLAHEVLNLALLKLDASAGEFLRKAVEKILDSKQEEFSSSMESLNPSERMAVEILVRARGQSLLSKEVLQEFGIAPSTLSKGLVRLQRKGVIFREGRTYQFQDIFFERWLMRTL